MANRIDEFSVVIDGLDHPEDVVRGPDGLLYAGGEAGEVYQVDLKRGTLKQIGTTGGAILGLVLDGSGSVYVCDYRRHEVIRMNVNDGSTTVYSTGTAADPLRMPNGIAFDTKGTLYFTDSGDAQLLDGVIFSVTPEGETRVFSRDVGRYPNGVVISKDEDYLYFAESLLPGVSRVRINEDGTAGAYEVVALIPDSFPDGVAFLDDGRLVVGCYQPDVVYLVTVDGDLSVLAEDPTRMKFNSPANIGFGGDDLELIVAANLGRQHLTGGDLGLRGLPLNYPTIDV